MTIQIKDIVLYSHNNKVRKLPLKAGALNIITGSSKTGKSALISIVDYCFGSKECLVPEGPIRRAVSWFGLRLQLSSGQAFIARKCPDSFKVSSEECFVDIANEVSIPKIEKLCQTTNTTGLVSLLSSWCDINENIHEPPLDQTRPPLSASIRQAIALCFQPQDEIIRRQQLFHGASDNFIAQAIKDTLPYFLGAVDDEYVAKREELRRLKEKLRNCERQLTEINSLRGSGVSKASTLLVQARDVGLTNKVANNWEETVDVLKTVGSVILCNVDEASNGGEEYIRLSKEREMLLDKLRHLKDDISLVRSFEQDENGYSREATEQKSRLTSINIFQGEDYIHVCPICNRNLSLDILPPSADQIMKTLSEVSMRLDSVVQAKPHIQKAIADIEKEIGNIQEMLNGNRAEMEAVRKLNDNLQHVRDNAAKQSHVLGRISLYLESLPELPDTKLLEMQAEELRKACKSLEVILSDDCIRERLESIASILGRWMTDWAKGLNLEHSEYPLRLDVKKITVVSDTAVGPVPMDRMGSGENWVGYHLIAHLALHRWFTERNRPVPRFLFIDQPSQVYFPPEKDSNGLLEVGSEEDREAVKRMFKLVSDVAKALSPKFQIIVTEHADIREDWYQSAVIERWRGGMKLIPDDWPQY